MADITDIERLNYYEGEYLGAVDFEAEQEYHRDMRRRHNIGQHTWGIVTGLDVAQFLNGGANNEVDVFIQPGVAIDGFGREIVVFGPYQLTADLFADFPAKQTLGVWIGYTQQMINPDSDTCASAGVTNAYSRVQEGFQIVVNPILPTNDPVEVAGNDVSPPSTTGWTQPATLPPLPTAEGGVVIAPDDSVPFQDLPDDNTAANWLVQLGSVLWDGTNQVFVQTGNGTANQNRQYVGSVASVIYAPAGVLTIQDRSTPPSVFDAAASSGAAATITAYSASAGVVTFTVSPALSTAYTAGQSVIFSGFTLGLRALNGQAFSVLGSPAPSATSFAIATGAVTGGGSDTGTATPQPPGVAVEVQGTLTVDEQLTAEQDVWLNGGNDYAMYFKDSGGADGDTVLYVQRLDGAAGGADLHVHIGDGSTNQQTAPQRLTVGYGAAGSYGNDTNVLIVAANGSVTIPAGPLSFGNQTGQMVNLSGTTYGIGVEANTLFFQSASNFAFCKNGDYNATQGSNPTASLSMFIDANGDMTLSGALVVDDANDNIGRVNPGLTFGNSGSEGIASKRTSGGNQNGLDFYTASNARMSIASGGNVGIGTTSPGTALDVHGGISVENNTFYLRAPTDAYHHIRYGTVGGLGDSDGVVFNSNFVVAHGPDGGETARLVVQGGGNVGIGTTSPGTALDVHGGISVENNTFYLRAPSDAYHHIRYGTVGGLGDSDGVVFNSNFVLAHGPDGGETARLVVQGGGNVGIGTMSPSEALQVAGAGLFGTDNKTISGSVNYGVVYLGDPNHYIRSVFNGGLRLGTYHAPDAIMVQQTTGNVTVSGNLTINGKLLCTNKSGYVVDRFFSRGKKALQRGDVVVLHTKPKTVYYGSENRIPIVEVTLARKAGDTRVCGVVDEPALSADETAGLDEKALAEGNVGDMVTLGAYACCKVIADAAPIAAGDLLMTSETAGHAQKFDPLLGGAGCIIGKALGSLEAGKGTIPVLISHQ